MARIRLIEPAEMEGEQLARYRHFPANLMRGLETAPQISIAYGKMGDAIHHAELPARLRELAIVRVGQLSSCAYELMQHKHLALAQGWSEAELEAVRAGDFARFDEAARHMLQFIDECVKSVRVSEETFQALQEYLPDRQMVELTMLIGHYMATARFLESFEIDLDDRPTSWERV